MKKLFLMTCFVFFMIPTPGQCGGGVGDFLDLMNEHFDTRAERRAPAPLYNPDTNVLVQHETMINLSGYFENISNGLQSVICIVSDLFKKREYQFEF